MTEQQLRQQFKDHSDCYSDSFEVIQAMTEDAVIELAKAYAADQVAAKDVEISELKAKNEQLEAENTKYLKSALEAQEPYLMALLDVRDLKAENERLGEVVKRTKQYCECGNGCGGATKLPSGIWLDEGEGTLYHAVLLALSPAPVTEGREIICKYCDDTGIDLNSSNCICQYGLVPKNEDQI